MASKKTSSGYVPAAGDADGSEDPAPPSVIHSTEAVSAGPPSKEKLKKMDVGISENGKTTHTTEIGAELQVPDALMPDQSAGTTKASGR